LIWRWEKLISDKPEMAAKDAVRRGYYNLALARYSATLLINALQKYVTRVYDFGCDNASVGPTTVYNPVVFTAPAGLLLQRRNLAIENGHLGNI